MSVSINGKGSITAAEVSKAAGSEGLSKAQLSDLATSSKKPSAAAATAPVPAAKRSAPTAAEKPVGAVAKSIAAAKAWQPAAGGAPRGSTAALRLAAKDALTRASPIRQGLIDVLKGETDDMHSTYAAAELAGKVGSRDKKIALEQVSAALARLASAPPAPAASHRRSVLSLMAARIRQPDAAKAIDTFAELKSRPFTYATLADTGVSQREFDALLGVVRGAVSSGNSSASEDIGGLWSAMSWIVGQSINFHDPKSGFARIKYSGDPLGPSFQQDVAALHALLA